VIGGQRLFVALAMALVPQLLNAQEYPVKPVRIIVPVGAGGATDILTRALAQRLSTVWNQQVIVDNRPGGGSNIGFEIAARAPADGYTLLMAQPAFTVNVSLYRKLAYDPLRDFSAITLTATSANVLVVHPTVPAKSLKELIALAKARPGQLSYGSAGNGTTPHLSGELFKSMSRIDIQHIPYKGGGQAVTNVLGGHVDMAFSSLASLAPQIKAQRLRALAVTSRNRSALMPYLPTFSEAGLSGYSVTGWFGVLAPNGTPKEVITRLHADITRALQEPELIQTLVTAGVEPATSQSPQQLAAFLQAEISKWAKVVKASGATVQ
jgi:tripartite-type tricarboxylate transporter receptor subunit TctC